MEEIAWMHFCNFWGGELNTKYSGCPDSTECRTKYRTRPIYIGTPVPVGKVQGEREEAPPLTEGRAVIVALLVK